MYIKREQLLNKLIRYRKKDIVKVITGIRRCGKSVLLNELFYEYLLSDGVPSDHIIKVSLDLKKWEALRNGDMLYHYIAEAVHDDELYYVFLDEIQLVEGFEEVVNSMLNFLLTGRQIRWMPLMNMYSLEGFPTLSGKRRSRKNVLIWI